MYPKIFRFNYLLKRGRVVLHRIWIALHYLLPKRCLTKLIGWGAQRRNGWMTRQAISLFLLFYKVDMSEAKNSDISNYSTFNTFFMRALRNGARAIDKNPLAIVSPADGIISQCGKIQEERILQAKGSYYTLEALLAGNKKIASCFSCGCFFTIYLTPRDYHRVHMPCDGVLNKMFYIPGKLFSVNPLILASIPGLFTRNERVICLFDTNFGPMIQILVGATIVGSIETVWAGAVTPPHGQFIRQWNYPPVTSNESVVLIKGQEMGGFKLGSTVISMFASKNVLLEAGLSALDVTRVGQKLAYLT